MDKKEVTPSNLELIGFTKVSSVEGECYQRGNDIVCFSFEGEVTSPQGDFYFGTLVNEIIERKQKLN